MSWNYRVISSPYPSEAHEEFRTFEVHEVYYDDNGGIHGVTEKCVSPYGETEEEIRADMVHFQEAFNKPILRMEDIEFVGVNTRYGA